jgi:hypothetical protein
VLLTLSIAALLLSIQRDPRSSVPGSQREPAASSRAWILGKVVDKSGKGVPKAEVFVTVPSSTTPTENTMREARSILTDSRGRFRVSCIRSSKTLVGARWKKRSGTWAVSRVSMPHSHREPLYICEEREVPALRPVTVSGWSGWRDKVQASLRLRDGLGQAHPLTIDSSGTLRLPPLPGTTELIELVSKKGKILCRSFIRKGRSGTQLILPPPFFVQVQVLESPGDTPIQNAAVYRLGVSNEGPAELLATTDGSGLAGFWWPVPRKGLIQRRRELLFCVLADRRETGVFGWNSRFADAKKDLTPATVKTASGVRIVRLAASKHAIGRLDGGSSQEWQSIDIQLRAHKPMREQFDRRLPRVSATKTQTSYRFPFAISEFEHGRITLVLSAEARRFLAKETQAWLELPASECVLKLEPMVPPTKLPDLDYREIRLLQIAIRRSDGEAAAYAKVHRLDRHSNLAHLSREWTLDSKGRWQRPVYLDPPPLLFLHRDEYRILERQTQLSNSKPGAPIALKARLKPMTTLDYRVVDEKGREVPGAKLALHTGNSLDDESRFKSRLHAIQKALYPITTDQAGRFALTFFPELTHSTRDGSVRITVRGEKEIRSWLLRLDSAKPEASEQLLVLEAFKASTTKVPFRRQKVRTLQPVHKKDCPQPIVSPHK